MKQLLAAFLAVQIGLPSWAVAQQPSNPVPAPAAVMLIGSLKILVLEGEGATNNTATHQGTPPVVEVRDENDRPVEGATVVFRLPPSGPGAAFPGQGLSRTLRTNLQGQVMATGLTPNNEVGSFKIHVTATAGNKIGEIDIRQNNSASSFAPRPEARRKLPGWWKWAAAGGAGAVVVGIVLATRGSGSKPSNPTVTINPGPVTIAIR